MSDSATLHSRLRVLIAKSYRAEKLYASMKSSSGGRAASLASVSDIANDIRSKEWQQSHSKLRAILGDVLSETSGAELGLKVSRVQRVFAEEARENLREIEKGKQQLRDALSREEFAHALKLNLDLIREKARVQANTVISDELASLLNLSGRKLSQVKQISMMTKSAGVNEASEISPLAPNVIPLKKRLLANQRT